MNVGQLFICFFFSFFISVLQFSRYRSFTSLAKFILQYFIIFDDILNGIDLHMLIHPCIPGINPTFFFAHATQHVESQFPGQGLNPCPLQCKHGVLTTGLPGKSHKSHLIMLYYLFKVQLNLVCQYFVEIFLYLCSLGILAYSFLVVSFSGFGIRIMLAS